MRTPEVEQEEQLMIEAANVFQGDTLFIHDCIRQLIQQYDLNIKDRSLRQAMIKLAIGVKKMEYPKTTK